MKFLLILFLLIPCEAHAQSASDKISYITVFSNITLDTINSIRSESRTDAFKKQAIRTGLTIGVSELLKHFISEERPDRSDDKSFPSEHSALSCVSIDFSNGKRFSYELPIAISTMSGRVMAKKHHIHDVLIGCAIGSLFSFIR